MTRLNLEQLRAFLAVVKLKSVNKAAQVLHVSQPAVTSRLKKLEEALGTPLFDRSASGMHLTRSGELLVRYAEQVAQIESRVLRDVMDPQGVAGLLRIGVPETIAQCWLPDWVSALHQRFPSLEIEVNVDISLNLRAALLSQEIDLAILMGPLSDYQVDNIVLPAFDLAWYVAADAVCPDDGPAAWLRRPVISYARHTRPYRELTTQLRDVVGPAARIFPSSSLSACFRMVAAGLGVAALPRALAKEYVDAGQLQAFDPGWVPPPLVFSVSYLGTPVNDLIATAGRMAEEIALGFSRISTELKEKPKKKRFD